MQPIQDDSKFGVGHVVENDDKDQGHGNLQEAFSCCMGHLQI